MSDVSNPAHDDCCAERFSGGRSNRLSDGDGRGYGHGVGVQWSRRQAIRSNVKRAAGTSSIDRNRNLHGTDSLFGDCG